MPTLWKATGSVYQYVVHGTTAPVMAATFSRSLSKQARRIGTTLPRKTLDKQVGDAQLRESATRSAEATALSSSDAAMIKAVASSQRNTRAAKQLSTSRADSFARMLMELKAAGARELNIAQSHILHVSSAPAFVDREEALSQFLLECKKKISTVDDNVKLDKTTSRIMAVYGGTGSGKTVFMNEIISRGDKLKMVLQDRFGQHQRFKSVVEEYIGVGITFNSFTETSPFEVALKLSMSQSVAARLFHTVFVKRDAKDYHFNSPSYQDFVTRHKDDLQLCNVVTHICQQLGKRHLLLCVDEMMKGALHNMQETDAEALHNAGINFDEFFSHISQILDGIPNFFLVCSSLNLRLLERGSTSSDRELVPITMAPLSFNSICQVYKETITKWKDPKMRANTKLAFFDLGGSPKLAYFLHDFLKDLEETEEMQYDEILFSLFTARTHYFAHAITGVQAKPGLFRQAVLLAILSDPVDLSATASDPAISADQLKLAVAHNFVQLSNVEPDTKIFPIPVVSVALLRILKLYANTRRLDLFKSLGPEKSEVFRNIIHLKVWRVLNSDTVNVVKYVRSGVEYEDQHTNLMDLRVSARCELLQASSFSMSMWDFLTCCRKAAAFTNFEEYSDAEIQQRLAKLSPRIVGSHLPFSETLTWPRHIKKITYSTSNESAEFTPGHLYRSTSQNNAGLDSVLCLNNTSGDKYVFVFQDKASDNTEKEQLLKKTEIYKAVCMIAKHHSASLSGYIDAGRFGLVFRVFRKVAIPKEGSWKSYFERKIINTRDEDLGPCESIRDRERKLALLHKIVNTTLIMDSKDVIRYLGPLFGGRPQFQISRNIEGSQDLNSTEGEPDR